MLDAVALAALDFLPSPAPSTDSIKTRDEVAQELHRLADLFWGVCRARGLGEDSARFPRLFVRWEVKDGITGCETERGITVTIGTTTWGAVIECLLHEICHALEPRAGHGARFLACLGEAAAAIFGVDVDTVGALDLGDPYMADRALLAAFADAFAWARVATPSTGTAYDFLVARLRRAAAARNARLVEDDLDLLRLAAPGAHVRVRGVVRGKKTHTLEWNLRAPGAGG